MGNDTHTKKRKNRPSVRKRRDQRRREAEDTVEGRDQAGTNENIEITSHGAKKKTRKDKNMQPMKSADGGGAEGQLSWTYGDLPGTTWLLSETGSSLNDRYLNSGLCENSQGHGSYWLEEDPGIQYEVRGAAALHRLLRQRPWRSRIFASAGGGRKSVHQHCRRLSTPPQGPSGRRVRLIAHLEGPTHPPGGREEHPRNCLPGLSLETRKIPFENCGRNCPSQGQEEAIKGYKKPAGAAPSRKR